MGIAFVVTVYPVAIVVPDARKSDHRPADHVLVAAVDRIGEEAFGHIFQQRIEEALRIDFVELYLAGLDFFKYAVLLFR